MLRSFPRLRTALLLALAACATPPAQEGGPVPFSQESWAALARPRPAPLPGAPRVAFTPVEGAFGPGTGVALAELMAARFLNGRALQVVDRRRFTAAAERERRGLPRPGDAPPLGTTPGARWLVGAAVVPGGATLRLTDAGTGAVRASWRVDVPGGTHRIALSRLLGDSLLDRLDAEGLLPAGPGGEGPPGDPVQDPEAAFRLFQEGVAHDDAYRWEEARRAYEAAAATGGPGFPEPLEALARVARLRAGGTLGAS